MNTSRYQNLQVVAPIPGLTERAEFSPRPLLVADDFVRAGLTWEYEVSQGERVDQIAYRSLGDSRLWWLIADLNPTVDPLFLVGGTTLTMPRMEQLQ